MELQIQPRKLNRQYHLSDKLSFSKEKVIKIIGKDFNKSVANIIGLVSLLDDTAVSDQDFKTIQKYLTTEANNLNLMVKDICS